MGRKRKKTNSDSVYKALRQHIRGAMRKVWSMYSPERSNALYRGKRTGQRINKDGTVSKVPMITYVCAECKLQHSIKDVQIDHLTPVSVTPEFPPKKATNGLTQEEWLGSWDAWLLRLHCDEDNLRILCRGCHLIKSNEERAQLRKAK